MIDRPDNLISHNPDKIVEMQKEILQMYGWPEWPPKSTPTDHPWWKENQSILPETKSIFIGTHAIFEINGLPEAGKSTIEASLAKTICEKLIERKMGHVQLLVVNDPVISSPFLGQDNSLIGLMDDDDLPPLYEKDDWMSSYLLQFNKLLYWEDRLKNPQKYSDLNTPTIELVDRGPTDALIWQYILLTHKGDPNFEIPTRFESFNKNHLNTAACLQILSNMTNAKIFMGVSQEVAQQRRALEGKEYKGWVTDSPIFKDLSAWTAYWINHVYPVVKEMKGSGILLVDGAQDKDKNVQKMADYIVESAWRLLPSS